MCEPEPAPAVPADARFAFSQASSSWKFFAGNVFLLTMTIGLLGNRASGSRSASRS